MSHDKCYNVTLKPNEYLELEGAILEDFPAYTAAVVVDGVDLVLYPVSRVASGGIILKIAGTSGKRSLFVGECLRQFNQPIAYGQKRACWDEKTGAYRVRLIQSTDQSHAKGTEGV